MPPKVTKDRSKVINYPRLLGRVADKDVPATLRQAMSRTPPPQDELALIFGYDNLMRRLFYYEPNAAIVRYIPNTDLVVEIDGKKYAIWRVKSMLLLGNPDCKPPGLDALAMFNPYEKRKK